MSSSNTAWLYLQTGHQNSWKTWKTRNVEETEFFSAFWYVFDEGVAAFGLFPKFFYWAEGYFALKCFFTVIVDACVAKGMFTVFAVFSVAANSDLVEFVLPVKWFPVNFLFFFQILVALTLGINCRLAENLTLCNVLNCFRPRLPSLPWLKTCHQTSQINDGASPSAFGLKNELVPSVSS